MKKTDICILLGTAHGANVAGKCSPDKSFYEWKYSREICEGLRKQLVNDGYRCIVDSTGDNEIGLANHCQIVNNYCGIFGTQNTVYISLHTNAAGADGKWHSARGWESHVAKNASANSIRLANLLWDAFSESGMKMRRPTQTQNYWKNDFVVLKKTKCPAVLTETGFQDNKEDVEWLLSPEGKKTVIECHKKAIENYVNELIKVKE